MGCAIDCGQLSRELGYTLVATFLGAFALSPGTQARGGMQGLAIRAAYAFHAGDGGCGKIFAYRYHASQITTARYARHALAYVLNNWRRHREDFANGALVPAYLDEYSSAVSFAGWTIEFARHPTHVPLPVSPPQTWLLRDGWKRYGAIDPHECPGPLW